MKLLFMQGTIVDRIDYNIQSVSTSVEEGLKQLQKVLFSLMLLLEETLLSLYDCKLEVFLSESLAAV